jgi:hypothetical protein
VQRSRLATLLARVLVLPACQARQTTYSTSTIDRTQTRTIRPSAAWRHLEAIRHRRSHPNKKTSDASVAR